MVDILQCNDSQHVWEWNMNHTWALPGGRIRQKYYIVNRGTQTYKKIGQHEADGRIDCRKHSGKKVFGLKDYAVPT